MPLPFVAVQINRHATDRRFIVLSARNTIQSVRLVDTVCIAIFPDQVADTGRPKARLLRRVAEVPDRNSHYQHSRLLPSIETAETLSAGGVGS